MNFIGGNNYLSDPDSDAELASMTGGDDSSVYPDSEAGSESVYSGGMELSDYELDSQCGGDTDAAILQMGGYQSDENVVVPTVAEQKGGASSEPIPHDVQVAVAITSEPKEEPAKTEPETKEAQAREAQSQPQREVEKAQAKEKDIGGIVVEESKNEDVLLEFKEDTVKKVIDKDIINKANLDTLFATYRSFEELNRAYKDEKDSKLSIDNILQISTSRHENVESNLSKIKFEKDQIDNFIQAKISENLVEDNFVQQGNSGTGIVMTDKLFETIIKCKTLSILLMAGLPPGKNDELVISYNKRNDNYEYDKFELNKKTQN
tara:strand:- start:116 stop:1075 length:960 start_codon:yes stop_codon:yes gene_type:complete